MPVFGASSNMNNNIPIQQVKNMRGQGLDNNQIIQSLQKDGFSSSEIFDAMNQADMASADPSMQQQGMMQNSNNKNSFGQPQSTQGIGAQNLDSGIPLMPSNNAQEMQQKVANYSEYAGASADSSNEEIIEAIIDEKWNDLLKDINKVIEWKNSMNNKIISLEQKFNDLRSEFDKLHSAILSKIDDYDKNITNVGAEVKAMDKVFSKVLPVFTENVAELSRITKDVKGSKAGASKKK